MVDKAPHIPPSADSLAARLAAFPTPASRLAEVIRQIDDLQEAAEIVEREAGVARDASNDLIGASVHANWALCAATPTSLADCLIIAGAAIGAAEVAADGTERGSGYDLASRASLAALKGIVAYLEQAA